MIKSIDLTNAGALTVRKYYLDTSFRVVLTLEQFDKFMKWMQKQNPEWIKHEGKGIGDGLVEISYIK